jgi:hypothetical protein
MERREMPKPKPNPLFKKLSGETTSQHMSRLRKTFPQKFKNRSPSEMVKKKFDAADIAAAEKRGEEKALAQKKTASVSTPSSPEPLPVPVPPPLTHASQVEAPLPGPATPDTVIFGASTPPPPKVDAASAGSPPPPPPEPPQGTPGVSAPPAAPPPPDNLGLATIVWTMLVNLFVAIFGPAWLPTSKDETEMCVSAWRAYFESIGIKPFSPLVNLWMAMFAYSAPRFGSIVAKFRKKKPAQPGAAPGSATETKAPAPPTPAPAAKVPAPEPTRPPAPAEPWRPAPAPAIGEIEDEP